MEQFNLHTHSFRCHHARGTDEEYVIKAIENGYKAIGFSDHAPYIFPNGYYSTFRIDLDMAQDYADSVRALGKKYQNDIRVLLGFEVEYYPQLIQKELEYLKGFGYDYLICGQHHIDNEYEPWQSYCGNAFTDTTMLDKYVKQVVAAAQSEEFAYIAHPDLPHFTGDQSLLLEKLREMLIALKEADVPIEYNFLGYTDKRNYPRDDFWRMAAQIGNRVVIGLDAHNPKVYADTKHLEKMKSHIASLGITPIDDVEMIFKKAAR